MYQVRLIIAVAIAFLTTVATGHVGTPPQLPSIEESAPATILYTDATVDIVGTSWCAYGVSTSLKCRQNGSYVTLTFNSVTTNSPHSNHLDTTWVVSLTPLNLAAGDTLVWEFSAAATAGPFAGRKVTIATTSQVQ
jgi:hypothetical protein